MKLLIITQKVDKNDPILGFFHRWIEEFAKLWEAVTVICLEKGEYHLPNNVKVLSLGKEVQQSRLRYLFKFYKYIWQERKNYDATFIHMNQEYVLLGFLIWKLWDKKIYLWRNHAKGSWWTRLAVLFSTKVFCTSSQSFTARFKKTQIMPVGIDTDFFSPDSSVPKILRSILFLGRIAPVKKLEVFIEVLNELQKLGVEFVATIAGAALTKDREYEKMVRAKVIDYGLSEKICFLGAVKQDEARSLYRGHWLYVNLTPAGSLDKTIFEAMACATIPLVHNQDLRAIIDEEFVVSNLDSKVVAKKIVRIVDGGNKNSFRDLVVGKHSLKNLMEHFFAEIN